MADNGHIEGTRNDLLSMFEQTGCLSEEMMIGYLGNTLDAQQKKNVETHLLDCSLCSDALEGLELLSSDDFKARTHEIRSEVSELAGVSAPRVVKLKPLRVAAAAAIIGVMTGLGWLFMKYLDDRSDKIARHAFEGNYEPYKPPMESTDEIILLDDEASSEEVTLPDESLAATHDSRARMESTTGTTATRTTEAPITDVRREAAAPPQPAGSTVSVDTIGFAAQGVAGGSNARVGDGVAASELHEVESTSKGRQARPEEKQVSHQKATGYATMEDANAADAREPEVRQQLLDEGVSYYSANQHTQALTNFSTVLAVEPSNETALFYSAVSYIESGQPAKAMANLDKILQNQNSAYYDSAQWYKAMGLLRNGQTKPARKQLNSIIGTGSPYENKARDALNDL